MDPRHPELAISRMRELMKQYDEVLYRMKHSRTSGNLAEYEREGSLVVQEICLVAPRLHEAMMQTSRQRRYDIARGVLVEPQDTLVKKPVENYVDAIGKENLGGESEPVEKRRSEALAEIAKQTEKISEQVSEIVDTVAKKVKKPVENYVAPNQAETVIVEPKPRKKKTTKKAKK